MWTQDIALGTGIGSLAVKRDTFQPQAKRMPMDEEDDLECDQGKFESEPGEVAIGKGRTTPGERADQDLFIALAVIHLDVQFFAGHMEAEIKPQIEAGERGHVEMFGGYFLEQAVAV